MRFNYWVIRYVPSAVRGEFINIGVVAGAGHDWAVRRVSNLQRASRLEVGAIDTKPFLERLSRNVERAAQPLDALVETHEQLSEFLIQDLAARMNGIVQLSQPRAILAQTAADAADIAFELMVVDEDSQTKHRSRTLVAKTLRGAFLDAPELQRYLTRSRRAIVEGQRMDFDVAVSDTVAVQLTQAWSFDLHDLSRLETNIQAWNYLMGLVRQRGGELIRPRDPHSSTIEIPRSVDANVVYRAPRSDEGRRQLDIALRGWDDLHIQAVEEADADRVVAQARALVSVGA